MDTLILRSFELGAQCLGSQRREGDVRFGLDVGIERLLSALATLGIPKLLLH